MAINPYGWRKMRVYRQQNINQIAMLLTSGRPLQGVFACWRISF
jgi:hypothetical protein